VFISGGVGKKEKGKKGRKIFCFSIVRLENRGGVGTGTKEAGPSLDK